MKAMTIIGDLEEEYVKEILETLLAFKISDEVDKEAPIQMVLSTYGGSINEMFSVYDLMREIREECEIHTHGVGKVMSAGVLLLAAGTKGKRKIGKNCRVMIHSVLAGCEGPYHVLENEMEEIRFLQEQYKNCLIEETNFTMTTLDKFFKSNKNTYLNAYQALKLGIVDEIV